jgi:hypothetical protein
VCPGGAAIAFLWGHMLVSPILDHDDAVCCPRNCLECECDAQSSEARSLTAYVRPYAVVRCEAITQSMDDETNKKHTLTEE